jgi:hypothetical protein
MSLIKVCLYDEEHSDRESVWAEDLGDGKAKLRNRPFMFPTLSHGSIVEYKHEPEFGIRTCYRSDGLTGEKRSEVIDAVWKQPQKIN